MFTTGQIIFAVLFFIAFVIVIYFSYKKDKKLHEKNYRGVIWVALSFVIFIGVLVFLKYSLRN